MITGQPLLKISRKKEGKKVSKSMATSKDYQLNKRENSSDVPGSKYPEGS